jgi:nucleoside phosphorylase
MYIIDYLVVIALDEEFRSAVATLSTTLGVKLPLRPEGPLVTARAALPFVEGGDSRVELLLAVCPGRMGHAAIAAVLPDVLDRYRPRDIILIGLSGSFDTKNLLLGDVLSPLKVFGYAEQKVVTTSDGDSWTFRTLGDRTTSRALAEVRTIADDPTLYKNWGSKCRTAARRDKRIANKIGTDAAHEAPIIHAHHNDSLASGNVVVASSRFAQQLKDQVDSTLRAVEMEAGGLFEALENVDWPGRVLVLRGISDYADEAKSRLEDESKDGWRAYAINNAARLAAVLISQRRKWDNTRRSVSPPYRILLEPHDHSYMKCVDMKVNNDDSGAHNLAFCPFLSREGGTPGFSLEVEADEELSPGKQAQMLLRETLSPYSEIRHRMQPNGRIKLTKGATEQPFDLELFVSTPPGPLRLTVHIIDEFGVSSTKSFP